MEIQNQDQEYTLGDTWSSQDDQQQKQTTGSLTNIAGNGDHITGSNGHLSGSRRHLTGSKLRIDGSHEHIAGNDQNIPVHNFHQIQASGDMEETETNITGSDGKTGGSEGHVTFTLAATAFITVFGSSFPHGWNIGVMNIPAAHIQNYINDSYR